MNQDPSLWSIVWRLIAGVLGIILVVFVFTWFTFGLNLGLRVVTAGIVGKSEAHIEIQSADFRLQAYPHFFDVCASVQANEDAMDISWQQLESMEEGSTAWLRKQQDYAAQARARQEGIREYNVDANKSWTIGQFRDEDLAFQLDPEAYDPEKGNKTTCVLS